MMDYEKGYVYKLMDQGVHLLKCISAQTRGRCKMEVLQRPLFQV